MTATARARRPWQLEMFELGLKQRQNVGMLLELLGSLDRQGCVLTTHADKPDSLNCHLAADGQWTWADLHDAGTHQMEELLGGRVHTARAGGSCSRVLVERHVVSDLPRWGSGGDDPGAEQAGGCSVRARFA
jgi:hypothetical protein